MNLVIFRNNGEEKVKEIIRSCERQKKPRGVKPHDRRYYKDVIVTFDIETTNLALRDISFMYIWQACIFPHVVILGRTWEEFKRFIDALSSSLSIDEKLMVFVHNLSFEFQFIKSILDFEDTSVFATDTRKILKCEYKNIEFRCSYFLSNRSLKLFTKDFHAKHGKLSGQTYDYSIVRYPDTVLKTLEYAYCIYDVLGLAEALENFISETFYTLPLTSTGFVRRTMRKSMHGCRSWLAKILPDLYIYDMLREAFRGGDTHANRHYSGQIVRSVKSMDESSAYPAQQCTRLFPMTAFTKVLDTSPENIYDLIMIHGKALLMRVAIWDICLMDEEDGFPYISVSKCRKVSAAVEDNGRILKADYLETTITDIDFKIILNQYTIKEISFMECFSSTYGELPENYTKIVKQYFIGKTELKGVEGMDEEYMKAKNMLNACYGMSVQRLDNMPILYFPETFTLEKDSTDDRKEAYNRNISRPFQSYAWGVWVTCWARHALRQGLEIVGKYGVYCDTDSVKYIIPDEAHERDIIEAKFKEYNAQAQDIAVDCGAFADDIKGARHYMGVYENDGEYTEFKTLGAKKYVYIDKKDEKLHVTISGVNKRLAPKELKSIDNFKEGFVFKTAGGTESVYNDVPQGNMKINGHDVYISSYVLIKDSTYTVGVTGDYERLLQNPDGFIEDFKEYLESEGIAYD